jgi:hypothetical protein
MVIYASCRVEELSVSSTVCKCVAHRFLTVFGHVGVMEWGANHPQRVIRAACHHDLRHVGSRGAGYAWQAVGSRKAGFFLCSVYPRLIWDVLLLCGYTDLRKAGLWFCEKVYRT